MSTVTLRPIDEDLLPRLRDLAVAGADLPEVLPAPDQSGWTHERRSAFADAYKDGYAIVADDELVGAIRMTPAEAPGAAEVGLWLIREARGRGHGTQALHLLVEAARSRGLTALIAETTTANQPAAGALRSLGAKLWEDTESGAIHATLRVGDSVAHGVRR